MPKGLEPKSSGTGKSRKRKMDVRLAALQDKVKKRRKKFWSRRRNTRPDISRHSKSHKTEQGNNIILKIRIVSVHLIQVACCWMIIVCIIAFVTLGSRALELYRYDSTHSYPHTDSVEHWLRSTATASKT